MWIQAKQGPGFSSLTTASKVSKYGVFSDPYFPVFELEKTPYLDTFHTVKNFILIKSG